GEDRGELGLSVQRCGVGGDGPGAGVVAQPGDDDCFAFSAAAVLGDAGGGVGLVGSELFGDPGGEPASVGVGFVAFWFGFESWERGGGFWCVWGSGTSGTNFRHDWFSYTCRGV